MRPDGDEPDGIRAFMTINRAVVPRHIDTATTSILAVKRVIVEQRMERFTLEEIHAVPAPISHFERELFVAFSESLRGE